MRTEEYYNSLSTEVMYNGWTFRREFNTVYDDYGIPTTYEKWFDSDNIVIR